MSTPHGLKLALEDPILLQNYIMNADWTSATLALVNSLPERDSDGHIIPSPVGGRRRIDFLLFRKEDQVVCIFQFTKHRKGQLKVSVNE